MTSGSGVAASSQHDRVPRHTPFSGSLPLALMGFIMTAPHRTRPLTRLGAGLLSGALALSLGGLTTAAFAATAPRAGLAPAAAGSDANRGGPASLGTAASSAIRQIAPGGLGRLTYNGTVDVAALPQISAAAAVAAGSGHHALTVDSWFRGPRTSAASKSTTAAGPLVTTPTVIHLNKGGTRGSQSSCSCQPPDTNAAISATRIVEAVNLSLTIYKRGGALISRTSLASWWPTTRSISDPHILYDNAAKRWILVFIPVPTSTTDTPTMYVAASTSADPASTWHRYTVTFSGGLFPAGTLLDYPMVGQDRNAILIGSNNFQLGLGGFSYLNSTIFAVPKSAAYGGLGFSFPAFATAFSTYPAIPRGNPMSAYGTSYALAANDAGGYSLYAMTNTGGTPTYTLQATTAGALWSPPPAALQPAPNQGVQLDTLDGRIQSPPVQADTFLWFTHSVALGSFPAVRYGAIPLSASGTGGASAQTANAFASSSSYDWNPSIALAEPTTNSVRIFLGWAMTDPTNGVNVSMRVSGVGPGEGVPSLAGIGTTVFTGGGSTSQTRFGDYSSVQMEVANISTTCRANTQALFTNQVFNGGDWQVRLARVGTC